MEGSVDLDGWVGYGRRRFTCQQTVTHPTSDRALHKAAMLIDIKLQSFLF